MVAAAAEGGLERIIYLGGLGSLTDPRISRHLKSRHEVGEILASGPVPVTVLRAAMILGSGSASFEILRYLTERLPVMISPRWVFTPSQPIAIGNVLDYLQGCLEHPETAGETFDIGGPDVLNYAQLVQIFAEEAGLRRRLIIPVPVLTPGLSARWIHLVTPVPAAIAQPLTEGLSVPTICEDRRIRDIVPLDLIGCRAAIRLALERVRQEMVETCWSDAGSLHPPEWAACGDAHYAGGTILECGYRVRLEDPVNGYADVVAENEKMRIAVEIETGKSDWEANIARDLQGHDQVIVVCTNELAYAQIVRQARERWLGEAPRLKVVRAQELC